MSYTELHYGKLIPILKDITIADLVKMVEQHENLEIERLREGAKYLEIIDKTKEYKEPLYIPYVFNKGTLYSMVEHSGELETDHLHQTIKNNDGSINFTYMFYNGGTCFSEMLEEGLNEIEE